ncbi:MAG: tyrosine--tRNA ligase [Anaerolineae bacterium]
MANVLDVLQDRGFVEQVSDEAGLRRALEQPITFYIGYDPSASSFHCGNLLTIMAAAHMQRHGHRPILIVGGGTGMIGDPSGRTEMRQLLDEDVIASNLATLREQLSRFIDMDRALMLNNADWLLDLRYIPFLRDIGRHFSVNRMLAAEAYRSRMETGLSFLEFNYQLLQAYDFLHLYREYRCTLQMGGNDQWGNILAGVDLVRRVEDAQVYGLTFPLLTTASGAKMGKTASGAVWLDADLLAPYDFYQYWVNTHDDDVERFLKIYTFLPLEEIRELAQLQGADIRKAKARLAFEVTRMVHGQQAAEEARDASEALFAQGNAADAVPTTAVDAAALSEGIPVVVLFEQVGLTDSRGAARRLIQQGGAYVNDERVMSVDALVTAAHLLDGEILLRAGKKRYRRITTE